MTAIMAEQPGISPVAFLLARLCDYSGCTPQKFAAQQSIVKFGPSDVEIATRLFRRSPERTMLDGEYGKAVARGGPPQVCERDPQMPSTLPDAKEPAERPSKGPRGSLYGHSFTAIIRRLAQAGWEYDEVWFFLSQVEGGKGISPATCKIQFRAGKKPDFDGRGDPAPLTPEQLAFCRSKCK
jgi:hypothetical protein